MSDVHLDVVDCIRSKTNAHRGFPPWTTPGDVMGDLHPAVAPETVQNVLQSLERADNRQQSPVIVRFDDPRHDSLERIVLLEESRLDRAAAELAETPDVARDVCKQLAERDPVPKDAIGAINTAIGRVEA